MFAVQSGLRWPLPGGGWPIGTLIDVLPSKASWARCGCWRRHWSRYPPQILSLGSMGLAPFALLWVHSKLGPNALRPAEQVLRSGSGLLIWPSHVRPESLRRLNLAAQAGDTLFFMLRPIAAAQDASPVPLRLSLRPGSGGVDVGFVKRRGRSAITACSFGSAVRATRPCIFLYQGCNQCERRRASFNL